MKWYIPLRRNYILINVFILCFFFTIVLKIGRWHKYNKCKILCMQMPARLGISNISERNWWWVWINLLIRIFLSRRSLCSAARHKRQPPPAPPRASLPTRPRPPKGANGLGAGRRWVKNAVRGGGGGTQGTETQRKGANHTHFHPRKFLWQLEGGRAT